MGDVVYLNDEKQEENDISLQRFYIFSEENNDITHSTVDVDSLFQLFDRKGVELSQETIDNLEEVVINALDDYYCNNKADLCMHQLLTVMALHCSYSKIFKEFKSIHPNKKSFSYFIAITKDSKDNVILREKILAIDKMISGELLNDVFIDIISQDSDQGITNSVQINY